MILDFMTVKLEDRSLLVLNGDTIFQLGDSVEVEYVNHISDNITYKACGIITNINKTEAYITLELYGSYMTLYLSCISDIKMLNQKIPVKDYIKDIVKLHRAKVLLRRIYYNNKDTSVSEGFLNTFNDALNSVISRIIDINEPGLVSAESVNDSGENVLKYYCTRCYEEITDSEVYYCPCCGSLVRDGKYSKEENNE